MCGSYSVRKFVPSRIYLNNTAVEHPEFNHGLGCVTKNNRHASQIAKDRGMIEVGNENMSKHRKEAAKEREKTRQKGWEEAHTEARKAIA
jgi:hypothetical protein